MSWPVGWRSKEEAERILKENCPDHSIVSWAFRFLASLDGMITILSGMYTLEQMKDNIGTMGKITPLKYRIAYLRSHIMSISKILFPSALYLHIPCFADFSFLSIHDGTEQRTAQMPAYRQRVQRPKCLLSLIHI